MAEKLPDIFKRYRVDSNGCWLWLGPVNKRGYGQRIIDGKWMLMHRAFLSHHLGEYIPSSIYVCHKCDVPRCVNPDHLFLGDAKINNEDCRRKGRHGTSERGEKHPMAKLKERDVSEILIQLHQGASPLAISRQYKVSEACIYMIKNGANWKHVPRPGTASAAIGATP